MHTTTKVHQFLIDSFSVIVQTHTHTQTKLKTILCFAGSLACRV